MGVAPAAWIVVSSQSLEVDKKRLGDLQEGFLPWEGGQTGLDRSTACVTIPKQETQCPSGEQIRKIFIIITTQFSVRFKAPSWGRKGNAVYLA